MRRWSEETGLEGTVGPRTRALPLVGKRERVWFESVRWRSESWCAPDKPTKICANAGVDIYNLIQIPAQQSEHTCIQSASRFVVEGRSG